MHASPLGHTHLSACLAQTQDSDPLEETTFARPVAQPADALNSHFLFAEPWESISVHCDHQSGILGARDTSGLEQQCVKSKGNIHTCLGRNNTTVCIIWHYCQSWRNLNKVLKYSPVQLNCAVSFSYCCDKTIGKKAFVLFTVQGCSPLDRTSLLQKHEAATHSPSTGCQGEIDAGPHLTVGSWSLAHEMVDRPSSN